MQPAVMAEYFSLICHLRRLSVSAWPHLLTVICPGICGCSADIIVGIIFRKFSKNFKFLKKAQTSRLCTNKNYLHPSPHCMANLTALIRSLLPSAPNMVMIGTATSPHPSVSNAMPTQMSPGRRQLSCTVLISIFGRREPVSLLLQQQGLILLLVQDPAYSFRFR